MKVSFDGMRMNGSRAYNRLARKLNEAAQSGDLHKSQVEAVRDCMEEVREFVGVLNCLYDEGGDYKELTDIRLVEFMPEEDEAPDGEKGPV